MWLLKQDVAEAIKLAKQREITGSADDRVKWQLSAEKKHASGDPKIMTRAGSTAEIKVEGVLTKHPDFFAWLFYGANTAYTDIQDALAIAASDPAVSDVVLSIDSPGGNVDGLFDALASLQAFDAKPLRVRASCACSAAYAIAAVAGNIEATNSAAEFGSVGVVASYRHDESVVDITSTHAPNKRPDVSTPEGQAVIREQLDAIHDLFVDAIATGRSKTVAQVNKNFGRGSVLLAGAAIDSGMIDSIAQPARVERNKGAVAEAAAPVQSRKIHMDEKELKAQHPELYAAVFAKGKGEGFEAGKEDGIAVERKRVSAHIKLADATGALKVAHDAIASGASSKDEDIFAEYQAAAFKRASLDASAADSEQASEVAANAETPVEEEPEKLDLQEQALALLESGKGVVRA